MPAVLAISTFEKGFLVVVGMSLVVHYHEFPSLFSPADSILLRIVN